MNIIKPITYVYRQPTFLKNNTLITTKIKYTTNIVYTANIYTQQTFYK